MSSLASNMENYLKKLLHLSAAGYIDIKRKELATKFKCVPSQVNYVLETRFTLEKGYLVESKRGGKGYLRIRKLNVSSEELLGMMLEDIVEGQITDSKARDFILRLYDGRLISFREWRMVEAVLDSLNYIEDDTLRSELRGWMLKKILFTLISL